MDPLQIRHPLSQAIRRCARAIYNTPEWTEAYHEVLLLAAEMEPLDPAKKLHRMAEDSLVSFEEFISSCGSEPSRWIHEGRNLAFPAARGAQLEKLRWLVENGVNPNVQDPSGYSPLFCATNQITGACLDIVCFLIGCSVDLDAASTHRESPLRTSLMWGDYKVSELLINAGAEWSRENFTPSHQAAAWGNDAEIAAQVEQRVDLQSKDIWGNTPWLVAIRAGRIETAQQLAGAGASVRVVNDWGDNALHLAAMGNHSSLIQHLISSGCSHEIGNSSQETPLHAAAMHDRLEAAMTLLINGAIATVEDEFGGQSINHATSVGMLDLLVRYGADVNHIDQCGEWPLKDFASYGKINVVRWLLDHGAEVDCTHTGGTALHDSVFNDHLDVTNLLLDRGANINQVNVDGDTPLQNIRSIAMAVLLLSRGADPLIGTILGIPENSSFIPLHVQDAIRAFREARNCPFKS